MILASLCALSLMACGGGTDEVPTRAGASAEPVEVSAAEFIEACAAFHESDLASHPSEVTAETFCGCVMTEMDAQLQGLMGSLESISGQDIPDGFEMTTVSSAAGRMAGYYRRDLKNNRSPGMMDDDYDALVHGPEMLASTQCAMRLSDL